MFVAAGPLRCASGPGDPQPFHSIASRFRLARLSERRRPAVPFTRLRPAFDLPGSRSVGGPQPPAAKARPNRRRWRGVSSVGRNSFGAVCEWGCEGSERPGLRSGSGNSESEAGSGPASPAIAGGPQPSAAKARNSLQSLPPFAGCAREPPLPSASRDPAPSTCLPSNGPVHFPPENRLAHLCPSTVPACRSISCLPRTAPARPPHRFFPRIMETDPRLRALSLRCPAPPCVALFPENKAWGGRCRQQHGGSSDETIAVGIPGCPHRVCGARPGFSRNPRLGSLRSPLSRTGRRPRRPRPR